MWRHNWRPVLFSLIVDDFGIKYVGNPNADHLLNALKENYKVTVNYKGKLYSGINLTWDYVKRTFRLTMDDYITNLHAKFDLPNPKKPQHSPHCRTPIIYEAKIQYAADIPSILPLENAGKIRI